MSRARRLAGARAILLSSLFRKFPCHDPYLLHTHGHGSLVIPGGLKKNDAFWIDLNKGVRALYFPARYQYSKDYPNDAAYAKVSFVEDGPSRQLIDGSAMMFVNTLGKLVLGQPADLSDISRATAENTALHREFHIGAYSFDSTLVVNVPKFIEASFEVAANFDGASPFDSIYLAKSADIKATRVKNKQPKWELPPEYYTWEWHTQKLMLSYSGQLSKADQINLQEVRSSDVSASAELAVNLLLMAASLIPYVGPVLSTLGGAVLDKMKDVENDSGAEQEEVAQRALGIATPTWNAIPGEAKEQLVKRTVSAVSKCVKMLRR